MAEVVLSDDVVAGKISWGPAFTRLEVPEQQKTYPPGTIIIPVGYLSRYTAWWQSLVTMLTPEQTEISSCAGVNICQNLNNAIAHMHGEWAWIMGDDHIFAHDTLLRLLAHDVDCVTPLCLMRQPPYSPLVFRQEYEDGSFEPWPVTELPTHGLHPCAAAGGSAWLIKRRVLDALQKPYFEKGMIRKDELGEDLYLYHKIRKAGFQPYIDCDTMIGHITPTALWPARREDGTWDITLDPSCSIPNSGYEGPA